MKMTATALFKIKFMLIAFFVMTSPAFAETQNFMGHEYLLVSTAMHWPEAKTYAESLGGHLVTIGDQAEQDFVCGIGPSRFWIGLYEPAGECNFAWVTGEPLNYTNWGQSQPTSCGGGTPEAGACEDYVEMGWPYSCDWNDLGCENNVNPFIVEFDEEPPTAITLSSFDTIRDNKKVSIVWATEAEINNAGFNIYRAHAGDSFVKINSSLISAEGSPTQGVAYKFVDTDVQNRKTYYYKLEDIDLNGTTTMHGPVSAKPRFIFGFRN